MMQLLRKLNDGVVAEVDNKVMCEERTFNQLSLNVCCLDVQTT